MMNTTTTPILLALMVAILVAMVASQSAQNQVEDFPLSTNTPVTCEEIMETHRFQGDCCALNTTVGGGCVLTVINGRCKISGQEWTLDYTSTFDSDGAVCPGSEFAPPGIVFATKAPVPAATEVPASAGVGSTSMMMMKTTASVSILLLAASILAVAF